MLDDWTARSEVKMTLVGLTQAYRRGNFDEIRAFYTEDPDIVWVGTDSFQSGQEAVTSILRLICSSREVEFRSDFTYQYTILLRGSIACVGTNLNLYFNENGKEVRRKARYTATLEKVGTRWIILQQHFSLPKE
jgi:ketosteroid isomerase-like protein